ncbi:hypothetical protein CROQUDRAFT_47800 [Cronartium quercuum f. sp. fusiforme G11]|uniref:Apyrase n=1 Tax=Cronartium quercuum f. sp. fusiforme G11 TaxID=708437 RepID=A0A9P6NCD7_9BASI|nr:hypothetical protein CROQUDRAFT_47800 [Cronartium quercuum f. sp. fusiforme G11]
MPTRRSADFAYSLPVNPSSSNSLPRRSPRPPPSTNEPDWHKGRRYGIVIDAGSSGSRVQIYSWRAHEVEVQLRKAASQPLNVLPRVETGVPNGPLWYHKVEPGISSFGLHPHDVGEYLKPLLEHALTVIPAHSVSTTPFYLLATAGMRLVPEAQRNAILHNACQYVMKHYRFVIRDCETDVRVITGEEEGGFGWIAVNYLMDGFDAHDGDQKASTFGFLDMGGASTQIAFEPTHAERTAHSDGLTKLRLRLLNGEDVTHSVFVTTWLGYGTNQARERYSQRLLGQAGVLNNTLPTTSSSSKHITTINDPCLPSSLTLPSPRADYQFKGSGNFTACITNLSPLLNKNAPCVNAPCLFDGKHVPSIDFSVNHFIGISEYWYSTQEVWSLGGAYDFVEFEKHAISYCKRKWDDIVRDHKSGTRWPTTVEISRLQSQCFKAAWIINILHEGIGIPRIVDRGGAGDHPGHASERVEKAAAKGLDSRPPSFQSLNDVGDVLVSWTLGKMVLEVSQSAPGRLQYEPPMPSASALATGDYVGGVRGVHLAQMTGIESQLDHMVSLVDPMAFLGAVALAIFLWFFCLSSRASFNRRCLQRSNHSAGYVLASMEEGAARDSLEVSATTTSRPSSPSPQLWRRSSSSMRVPSHSSRYQPPSTLLGSLSPLRMACQVARVLTSQARSWLERPSKPFSPPPVVFPNGNTVGVDVQPDPRPIIPPSSITTSLSHASFTGPSPEDPSTSLTAERLALTTLRPHSTVPDDPHGPKQRLSHSYSFDTRPIHRDMSLDTNPPDDGLLLPPRIRISSSSSTGGGVSEDWTSPVAIISPSASQVSLTSFYARKGRHDD